MNTQTDKSDAALPMIVFIAVMLLGAAVVARTLGWLPNSIFDFGNIRPIEVLSKAVAEPVAIDRSQAPSDASSTARCPECGVIVSMREIDAVGPSAGHSPVSQTLANGETGLRGSDARSYEFSVRLSGGARRVIIATDPTSWRVGERVIIIDGTNASQP